MQNILIPMDFTSVAMNALKYGLGLFESANIFVLHTISSTGKNPELIGAIPGQTNVQFLEAELHKWILHELHLQELPKNITIIVARGNTNEVVMKELQDKQYECVLMGTRDNYSLFDKWLGTVSLGLVKTINIPLYLIPRYAKYKPFEKVVIASDAHLSRSLYLDRIAEWNRAHTAFLDFIHIKKSDKDNLDEEVVQIVKRYFENTNVNFGFQINEIQSDDVCKTILANAINEHADLIMILPDNQSYLKSIFVNSISREMILSSSLPLLFLNTKGNS